MDLTEFVKDTVAQVARGVSQAHDEIRAMGMSAKSDNTLMVKFDVAIAVSRDPDSQNNRINVVSVGEGESSAPAYHTNSPVHRISFQIPFSLSVDDPAKRKLQEQQAKNQAVIEQRIERFTSPFS